MAIAATPTHSNEYETISGVFIRKTTFVVTGLTATSTNTVPHGLPFTPRRVAPVPVGNGAVGVMVSLDTSQGVADPAGALAGGKTGWDATNIYIYIGAGTQCLLLVEY